MDKKAAIYYHDQCYDGYTAAYVALIALRHQWNYTRNDIALVPADHGKPLSFAQATTHFFVDFCPKKEVLEKLLNEQPLIIVVILDHHETAKWVLDFQDYRVTAIVADNRSGCQVVWDYFKLGKKRAKIVDYMGYRDLFQFDKMEGTREVFQYVQMKSGLLFDEMLWEEIWEDVEDDTDRVIKWGSNLLRQFNALCDSQISANMTFFPIPGTNLKYGIINTSIEFGSEICHRVCKHEGIAFAGYYIDTKMYRKYGLRGDKYPIDDLAIAMGGGGHKLAAGFSSGFDENLYFTAKFGDAVEKKFKA